ncbi:gag-pol polyprotein [Phytophthora cinnamomi]|uniref:gag-pol polyprotein n=1 Tax=Phytophthora cinnamomi TaxID=4785 RepID=UPI00355A36B7|nr:gag-pol polyprotein [Phytophthora cinnamomi]
MMAEGDDVLEHINKIKTLAEQLDAVGAPVSEDDLVITLLASLSESYQFLITSLESRADSLTWELMTARLLHEDLKRKEQGGGAEGTAHGQAFMTSGNGKGKGRQAQKTSACHYCGEQGHWIVKCPVRIRENAERQKPQRANVANEDEGFDGDYLFSVGGGATKSSEVWLVDSGATQHMTYSKEYMKNYKKMAPVDVHLADDGVVQAVGSGDIVMSMKTPREIKKRVLTATVKQWKLCDGCALDKQTRVSYMLKSQNRAKKLLEVIHSDVCGPMKTQTFSGKKYFATFIDEYSHFCVVYLLQNKSEVAAKFAKFVAFAET